MRNIRKIAIIFYLLGPKIGKKVLKYLPEEMSLKILQEMIKIDEVTPSEAIESLSEFLERYRAYKKEFPTLPLLIFILLGFLVWLGMQWKGTVQYISKAVELGIGHLIVLPFLAHYILSRKERFLLKRPNLNQIFWAVVAGISIGVVLVIQNIKNPPLQMLPIGLKILRMIAATTYGPATEEFFFRGIILRRLSISYGSTIALIASSVLFALIHSLYTFEEFVMYTVIGLGLGILFERTENLWTTTIAHSIGNLWVYLFTST